MPGKRLLRKPDNDVRLGNGAWPVMSGGGDVKTKGGLAVPDDLTQPDESARAAQRGALGSKTLSSPTSESAGSVADGSQVLVPTVCCR